MSKTPAFSALALTLALVAACSPGDPPRTVGIDGDLFVRTPDSLLHRPELQRVVEAGLDRDVAALRDALGDPDPAVRARAAFALGSVRSVGAGPDLSALLDDPDPRVRADAAFALGQIPQAGGSEENILRRLDAETERTVRDELIDALGREGRAPGVQRLLTLSDDDLPAATRALARAFVRNARPVGMRDTLVQRLTHTDPVVRQYAAWALGRVEDITVWIDRRIEMRNALAGMAPDDPAAMYLIQALGKRPDVFSLPRVLERYRTSTDWRVRSNAVASMQTMGMGAEQAALVVRALQDPAPLVRLQAAQLMEQASPVEPWMEAAEAVVAQDEADLAIVGPLLTFLARTAQKEPVLAWLGTLAPDDYDRWRATEAALRELEGQEAVDILRGGVASPDTRVSELAARGLRRRWELSRAFPETHGYFFAALDQALSDALRSDSPGAVREVVAALGHPDLVARGSVALVQGRLSSLPSGALREAVMQALAEAEAPEMMALGQGMASSSMDRIEAARDPVPPVDWDYLRTLGPRPRLVLDTEEGRVVVVLDTESAPLTVQTLARVANAGRFDGVPFHRVIPNFVAQGGDLALAPGGGEPLGHAMRSELTRIRFAPGTEGRNRVLGMARTAEYDTESTQFFVTHSMQPHLDGGYTALGQVVDGQAVLDRILPLDLIVRARIVPGALLSTAPPN